jgi:hypothetical protein
MSPHTTTRAAVAALLAVTAPTPIWSAEGAGKDPVRCGPHGVIVRLGLDYQPAKGAAVRGAKVELDYPAAKARMSESASGSASTLENLFDADGSRGSLLVPNNRDTDGDGRPDRLTFVYSATQDLPAAPSALVGVPLACGPEDSLRREDFRCALLDAVDSVPNPVKGVSCALVSIEAR